MERLPEEDTINLIDLALVLAKRKWLILGVSLCCAILTAIISLIMPPIYRAETRLLPPQEQSSSLAMQMVSELGGGIGAGLLGMKTPNKLYAEMLKSNTVLDRIIDRFRLLELYGEEYRLDAREALLDHIDVNVDEKSGIVTLSVEDKDSKRAADMANAFVEELKNLVKNLAITEASQRRLFFEEQLKDTKEKLAKAEEEFQRFQEKTGAIKVEEQAKAVIESIAELRAQIAAKEVELRVMRTYATPYNPDLQKAEEALRTMRAQLRELERKAPAENPDSLVPTGRLPKVGLEYLRNLREIKFLETLYELLFKGYEQSKLDEARDTVIIQQIDRAIPPDKRAKPKRILMVTVALFTGLFFSIFLAFVLEYKENISQDPEQREKFSLLRQHLRFSFRKRPGMPSDCP